MSAGGHFLRVPDASPPLSAAAPAWRPLPHTVSLLRADDQRALTLPCDLTTLTVGDLHKAAGREWGPGPFGLWYGVEQLFDLSSRALDVGVGNRAVVLVRSSGPLPAAQEQGLVQEQGLMGSDGAPLMYPAQLCPGPECSADAAAQQLPLAAQPVLLQGPGGEAPFDPCWGALGGLGSEEFARQAQSPHGASALVDVLASDPVGAHQIIDQIMHGPWLGALCAHQHASRVMCTVAELASPDQAAAMLAQLAQNQLGDVVSSHTGGAVLCELIAKCKDEGAAAVLVGNLDPEDLCCSVTGRKVALEVIKCIPTHLLESFYGALAHGLLDIAAHRVGCISLQRILDCSKGHWRREQLEAQIVEATHDLISDPYGNYLLQHVISEDQRAGQDVARRLEGQLVHCACSKYASNVVECCLKNAPDVARGWIIREMLDPAALEILVNDAYGNFVVQSAIERCPQTLLPELQAALSRFAPYSAFRERIEMKLRRRCSTRGGGHAQRAAAAARPRGAGARGRWG
eukprot:TRINITY_DN47079_c0_g1_i1.p1 TRINITY_DN47079_c0_g1~~TRINITY_DN47079_c0_g1_i1.p1  ORF type:complete len:516 (+),score=147.63 TRINITY_DN47079_c0_g1_i1:91-1638(+)